jgi:transposase
LHYYRPRGGPGPSSPCAMQIALMPDRVSQAPRRFASNLSGRSLANVASPCSHVAGWWSTLAWTGRCRRLARDHESTPTSATGFFVLAAAIVRSGDLPGP